MYGELLPVGGGDPIPLLKKTLLVGRRESCDIVLRFSNVSAHHCQLTVNGGYWHVRDLQSRNGLKVNGVRVTEKRLDPGDILSIAKHKYVVKYSPVDLGAVGPPPPEVAEADVFGKSLLERRRAAAPARREGGRRPVAGRPRRFEALRSDQRRAGATQGEPTALMGKERKIRAEFRKNRNVRARRTDWTRQFDEHGFQEEAPPQSERVSGKGELTRHRTIRGSQLPGGDEPALDVRVEVDASCCRGRVLSVLGLTSTVRTEDGRIFQCATRRLLKTLATDQRNVVAAGDRVLLRPADDAAQNEGFIERVEPRHGIISRTVRGRQQVLVANVDQLLIVASAAEPRLKPNLIDRLLVTAEKGRVRPVICINKIDLVDAADLEPLVGRLQPHGLRGPVAQRQDRFRRRAASRRLLAGRESVLAGQSGVGKSSLLNAVDPGLHLRGGRGQRREREGPPHDHRRPAAAAGLRRLRGRHAGHAPVPALGRDCRGGGRLLPRPAALREPLPLPRLHAHPRGRLCRQGRRGRRPAGRAALRELLSFAERTRGVASPLSIRERVRVSGN